MKSLKKISENKKSDSKRKTIDKHRKESFNSNLSQEINK